MDDLDISDAPAIHVLNDNEESVDIYEDLDFGSSSKDGQSIHQVVPEKSSPVGVRESMDLFEEIVTEEQQSKEACFTELKSRFQAAQSQITELHRRLEQLELQNTGLSKENCRLKMNISILLQTARQEVTRKDTEIMRLNQQFNKGHYYQSRNNNLRDPGCSGLNQRPPPPQAHTAQPPATRPPPPSHPINPPSQPSKPSKPSQPSKPPQPSHLPSKGATPSPAPCPVPPAALNAPPPPTRPSLLSHLRPKAGAPTPVTRLTTSETPPHPPRPTDPPSHPPPPPPKEPPCLPDRTPTPPPPPSSPPPAPPPPLPLRDDLPASSKRDSEKHPSSQPPSCVRSLRSSGEDKPDKHRHYSDRHRDKKYKTESNRKSRNTSDPSNERYERRDSYKDQKSRDYKSGENKLNASESDHGKGHSSKEDHRRARDRHSRGSDSKERRNSERHKDSSRSDSSRSEHRPSKDRERRDEDGTKKHRRDSKDKHRSKEHSKKHSKKRLSKEKNVSEKEENSPNRKLCFMETLNLTLSPVKKVGGIFDDGLEEPTGEANKPQEDQHNSEEDSSQPNAEDMCVIDEVNSSELEATPVKHLEPSKGTSEVKDSCKDVGSQQEKSIDTTSEKELISNSTDSAVHNKDKNVSPKCMSSPITESRNEEMVKSSEDKLDEMEIVKSTIEPANVSKANIGELESELSLTVECIKKTSPNIQPQISPISSPTSAHKKDICSPEKPPKELETVSSSISLESLPQEGISLPEAINLLTQSNDDSNSGVSQEPTSSTGCVGVSKVSSTTQETPTCPERYREITKTPKKNSSPARFLSPGRVAEKSIRPSSSVPLIHDEDSMMRTLSSLKRIPDAISPLRSPIRITRRNQQHLLHKPGHVKSLHKEFSSPPADISKKVDVNKENKYPGSPLAPAEKASDVPSDPELEEGEILSESDEAASPLPPTKRAKLTRPIRTKASPKVSPKSVLQRKSEEKSPKDTSDSSETVRSPPNKCRYKTVCPPSTKSSFSSIEEVMDTFKLVRAEIRKKYMKLHKTFPKKSFYGVMDNFQESFIEFVDGADFGQICSLTGELKSKLKKIIASVFGKVLNNGIVKRIFEQQAVDLKQKLWDFVDNQVDFLFKDVHTTLKSLCNATKSPVERVNPKKIEKPKVKHSPVKKKELLSPPSVSRIKSCAIVPYRTGLGSRGKGIRISNDNDDDPTPQSPSTVITIIPSSPEKENTSIAVAHNSLLDKTDFQLLTEQQASSLTFNLVRDSQMGEIFKCLLQGSDLLDSSTAVGDHSTTWTLSTPRKDGERIISITTPNKFHSPSKLLSPNKFESPSRLVATWSSISPRKVSSPRSKVLINPALFDESCLLEVPSDSKCIQRPYSLLAEDLAVSLTIPSPLKSDSHLSFLQPPPVHVLSTPDSVLSAHISEDALLEESDATEHDIHLTLDTDNSSCGSSASVGSQGAPTSFLFKPDVPMQALVMERSNDHFIVKIRQTPSANSTLTANDSLNQTLTEEVDSYGGLDNGVCSNELQSKDGPSNEMQEEDVTSKAKTKKLASPKTTKIHSEKEQKLEKSSCSTSKISPKSVPQITLSILEKTPTKDLPAQTTLNLQQSQKSPATKNTIRASSDSSEVPLSQASNSHTSDSDIEEMVHVSESERSLTIAEESTPEKPKACKDKDRKRKKNEGKNQKKSKAKRRRIEDSPEETAVDTLLSPSMSPSLSPNSLSAKNLVKRKGEVVLTWTRDEDRAILIELKTRGPSRETFSALSEKLNKPSSQIAQRFYQLMKLFKKQEKNT